MESNPLLITVEYDPSRLTGKFRRTSISATSSIWERLTARSLSQGFEARIESDVVEVPWSAALAIVREFGTKSQQSSLNFRFQPVGEAAPKIQRFAQELIVSRKARDTLVLTIDQDVIVKQLRERGFTKRSLKSFQLRDLQRLLSLPHGANFSVPGSGKTTVTFALHLLTRKPETRLFVVAPKSAFPVWADIVDECMDVSALPSDREAFTFLDGGEDVTDRVLQSDASRFVMSYDLMVRQSSLVASFFARRTVHLVLDEAHRMKAGQGSQRGAFLLQTAPLLSRRDILTGTPMPQGPSDLSSQLAFLWPGQGLDLQIDRGVAPRAVMGSLYVRTTKKELGLPPARRHFRAVGMSQGQLALYSIVRSEALRQLSSLRKSGPSASIDIVAARRSVMRLLQLSSNPILALTSMTDDVAGIDSGIIDQVINEGPSQKMVAVADHARELARMGRKCVIWTIFTDTILELERQLADLNPVTLYGAIPSGDPADSSTREGRLRRFHSDEKCMVVVANPAAAGEGISLHTVCHDAIYLDRSYVSTHYLQSIDRIHRLGLPPDVETNVFIYQSKAPIGIGSIDASVSRRLATKVRGLQQLLDDQDLHEIAFDEESAADPVDFDIDMQDLVDLLAELEGKGAQEAGDGA